MLWVVREVCTDMLLPTPIRISSDVALFKKHHLSQEIDGALVDTRPEGLSNSFLVDEALPTV